MKLEGVIHCEGPECQSHQHVGIPNMQAGRLPVGWVRASEYGDVGPAEFGFCGWNCLLKFAAKIEPPETVSWDDLKGDNTGEGEGC